LKAEQHFTFLRTGIQQKKNPSHSSAGDITVRSQMSARLTGRYKNYMGKLYTRGFKIYGDK
jgi:hypothetical protein